MATTLASLNVLVGADIGGLTKGLKKATSTIGRVGDQLKSIGAVAGKFAVPAAAAFTAIGGAAVGAAVKIGNMADELLDLEQMTGLTTDQLQEFRRVATVAGVGPDTIAEAAQRLTTRLRAAGTDTATFVDNMKALGVSSKDATGNLRPMSELLPEIIRAMQGTEDITKRNALAAQIFGRSYQTLAPILGLTTDQFDKARQSAHDLGLVIGRDSLNAANEFRVQWQTLRDVMGGAAARIGVELIPAMSKMVSVIQNSVVPAIQRFTDFLGLTNEEVRGFRIEVARLGEADRQVRLEQLQAQFREVRIAANDAALAFAKFKETAAPGAGLSSLSPERFATLSKRAKETAKELGIIEQKLRAFEQPSSPIIPAATTENIKAAASAITNQLTPAQQLMLAQLDSITPRLATMNAALGQVPVLVHEVGSVLQVAGEQIRTFGDQLRDVGVETFGRFTDAIADFATGSKNAFESFVNAAIADLARLTARYLVFQALTALFPGSGFVAGIGKAFGFLASGGLAMAGRPYVVGEAGPELFVPRTAGEVIANDELRGGGGSSGPSAAQLASAILSSIGPRPRAMSPESVAVDDWYRRLIGAQMTDWQDRGGRLRGS